MVKEGFIEEVHFLSHSMCLDFNQQESGKNVSWSRSCFRRPALASRLEVRQVLETKKTRGLSWGQGAESGPGGNVQEWPPLCHHSHG